MILQDMQAIVILCSSLLIASASASPCPHPCKCFVTDNRIQAANCTDLPDQMTTAWPQKILRIHFGSHHASPVMLKNKAFKHFPGLTYLDITGGMGYVGNSAFDGLPELMELNLVGTGIRKLHRNTFATNRKLAFLSLRNNPRLFVAPSFLVSESITELDLSECALSTLKSVYFKGLPSLKYLFAMKNELKFLGSQFGPSELKYVNLANNYIENIYEDLDVYKRLRTIDLTGNPVNCTCELSEIDTKLTARGVAFGNTITCKNTGKPLGDMVEVCLDKEMMGDDPGEIIKSEHLLPMDNSSKQSADDTYYSGSGSGSGDGEFTLTNTEIKNSSVEDVKNDTQVEDSENSTQLTEDAKNITQFEGILTKTNVGQQLAQPTSSEVADVETAPSESVTAANVSSSEDSTAVENNTSVPVEGVRVAAPSTQTVPDGSSTTTRSGVDRGIVPQTIQAPETEDDDAVQTKVAEYLKSNVGITGTAVILAIVIVAIVYKAVCVGKSRSGRRGISNGNAQAVGDKSVELKEIKYMPADTEDSHNRRDDTPSGSVEENLLDEHDDDDDGGEPNVTSSPPVVAAVNGRAQNGLFNSVMDAVKNNNGEPVNGNGQCPQDLQVPTRVVVKLGETPKASKPVTINNVH